MQVSINGLSERAYFGLSDFFMRNHVTSRNTHEVYRGKSGHAEQEFNIDFRIENDARVSIECRNDFMWIWVHDGDKYAYKIHKSDFTTVRII